MSQDPTPTPAPAGLPVGTQIIAPALVWTELPTGAAVQSVRIQFRSATRLIYSIDEGVLSIQVQP